MTSYRHLSRRVDRTRKNKLVDVRRISCDSESPVTFISPNGHLTMKTAILVPLFCLAISVFRATATEYWVDGVSRNGGWYDAVKYGNLNDSRDSNLCWAASAANMLQWWQARYEIPEGIPNGDEIWNDIRNTTDNSPNTANVALTAYLLKYYSDLYPNSQYITNSGIVDYLQFLGSPDNYTKPSSYLGSAHILSTR